MDEPRKDLVVQSQTPALTPLAAANTNAGRTLSMPRKVTALAVAAISDAISLGAEFLPPLQIAVDVVTAIVLFSVLGFRWPLLPVLVVEAIPGVAAFPSWVLVVGVLVGVTPTAKTTA